MIDPPAMALRRRSDELEAAAKREMGHDEDAGALLLFYAAECGLKSVYMVRNNLKHAGEARGAAASARSFVHDLQRLSSALGIPKSTFAPYPDLILSRTAAATNVSSLHQAWRYGERIRNTTEVCDWLMRMVDWVKKNR